MNSSHKVLNELKAWAIAGLLGVLLAAGGAVAQRPPTKETPPSKAPGAESKAPDQQGKDAAPEHLVTPGEAKELFSSVDRILKFVSGETELPVRQEVKRELVNRIGVLDLRFFGYFGDIDYGMRAHLAGFKLICAKGGWLFHEGSGHVKQEMMHQGVTYEQAYERRMALVETAYRQFREKWRLDHVPAEWEGGKHMASLNFMEIARTHGDNVALKYEFPQQALDDLEII